MPERKKTLIDLSNNLDSFSSAASAAPDTIDAARMAGPLVQKGDDTQKASFRDEYGLGAGILALGGVFGRAKFAPRFAGKGLLELGKLMTGANFAPRVAGKGLLALGIHSARRTGSKVGHGAVGALTGAALITPAAYLSAKAAENSQNDKNFNATNFASIAAPAAVSGLLSYGMFSNISQSISGADRTGYKGMVKNILSPKRNIRYAKHGFKLAGRAFDHVDTSKVSKVKPGLNLSRLKRAKGLTGTQWKGRAGGMLALGMLGMEAIAPGMYLGQTLKNKKENSNGRV